MCHIVYITVAVSIYRKMLFYIYFETKILFRSVDKIADQAFIKIINIAQNNVVYNIAD